MEATSEECCVRILFYSTTGVSLLFKVVQFFCSDFFAQAGWEARGCSK